jgi:hypothetical protein
MEDREKIKKQLVTKCKDNKISCKTALELSSEEQVAPSLIGEICDELGVRIVACQLGCFK